MPVPNLEGKVQGPIDRVCKINSHIRENLQSLGFLICEYRRDCTAPNTVSCRQSKNYDLQSVCSTCKNVEYMYRTFSVAVSVAVMMLKKGSVERFCESVYEFLHELCVLHIFVVSGAKCTYDLTKFPTTVHFAFPASFASKVAKVRAKFRTS